MYDCADQEANFQPKILLSDLFLIDLPADHRDHGTFPSDQFMANNRLIGGRIPRLEFDGDTETMQIHVLCFPAHLAIVNKAAIDVSLSNG
jgi:hypothetical protein